jgi:hypothetical protein
MVHPVFQMTEHYMCNRTFTDTNSKMIPPGVSVNITKMLQYEQKMDSQYFLSEDPTQFDWRSMLRQVVPPTVWTARLERKVRIVRMSVRQAAPIAKTTCHTRSRFGRLYETT